MNILRACSEITNQPVAKIILFGVGVFASASLGPLSVLGTYDLLRTPFSNAPNNEAFVDLELLAAGGVLGLSGAWMRVLIPARRFRSSAALRNVTSGLLTCGALVVVVLSYVAGKDAKLSDLIFPGLLFALAIFLIAATLGETPDAP